MKKKINNTGKSIAFIALDDICCLYRNANFTQFTELYCIKMMLDNEDLIYELYETMPDDLNEMKQIIKELKELNNL